MSHNDEGGHDLFHEIINQQKYAMPYFLLKPLPDVLKMTNPCLLQGFQAMVDGAVIKHSESMAVIHPGDFWEYP